MKKNLEIYLHIPFCMKKCDYCDFLSFNADEQTQKEYIKALIRDIRYYGENMQEYQVSTIYIGGGTPSWMNEIWIQTIMAELLEAFDVIGNAAAIMATRIKVLIFLCPTISSSPAGGISDAFDRIFPSILSRAASSGQILS